tara:strand:- start:461 stop:1309 length:849 start_codon:yes stop_codon:yes gene_type:complete
MTYCIYHIPGVKIGVTNNVYDRVEKQQGYKDSEYEILEMSDDIDYISHLEIELQKKYGYRVDRKLYSKLFNNNFIKLKNMNINVTEMTTTFPCPVNKLKGQLMDNIGMRWDIASSNVVITDATIKWIMQNVKSSQYTAGRCYIYNKAFVRWFDNNNAFDQYNGKTITGALAPTGVRCAPCVEPDCDKSLFDCIRTWAKNRGLYDKGDIKTQYIKLIEEVGEIGKAMLKEDTEEVIDGIGDSVVVLTNLAELVGVPIEECMQIAYDEIKDRTGKMNNGTFKKD